MAQSDDAAHKWSSACTAAAADLVVRRMSANEGSHDHVHVFRVHALALRIAQEIQDPVDLQVLELGALLHDIYDHKLWTPNPTESNPRTATELLADDIRTVIGIYEPSAIEHISMIANGISYSKQVKNPDLLNSSRSIEMDIVQDADRLDAIGAIGIARCFSYGGSLGNPLSHGRYHFNEKLFKLSSLMRTVPGSRMAAKREQFMRQFVDQYDLELQEAQSYT